MKDKLKTMSEPITITTANIDALIGGIKAEMEKANHGADTTPWYMIFPKSIRGELNRKKYLGRGRPRNSDYHRIPFPDYLPANFFTKKTPRKSVYHCNLA